MEGKVGGLHSNREKQAGIYVEKNEIKKEKRI